MAGSVGANILDESVQCPASPTTAELEKLCFSRLRFRLHLDTPLQLPPFSGSTLRGGFGIAFKQAVCVVDHGECGRCLLQRKCSYAYVFETPIPDGSRRMASYEHAPHPFVLDPPTDRRIRYGAGDHLDLGLTLIGRGIDYLPYVIFAFEHLGRHQGIGKSIAPSPRDSRGKFRVQSVFQDGNGGRHEIYDGEKKSLLAEARAETLTTLTRKQLGSQRITLRFLTPARMVSERQLATVPEFPIVIRTLLRRLASLAYFHGATDLDLDYANLVEAAHAVRLIDNQCRWHDWERYSARQDTKLKMGGLVGAATYEGNLGPFGELLALAEVLHVGKGTGMGLGRIEVHD